MEWVELGKAEQFSEGTSVIKTAVGDILIGHFKGQLVAADAKCPHAGATLVNADRDDNIVTCPLHGWRFDMLDDGAEIHGYAGLTMRELKVEAGLVYLRA